MKNITNFTISLVLIIITILILFNPSIIITSVNYSKDLFLTSVFPTLLPFFILSEILINYNITYYLSKILEKPFSFLFNIKAESSFVIFLSSLSGLPSNAKYTKELLDNNIINQDEATKLLTFSYFPNPMFIIATIGVMFFSSLKIGIILLITTFLTNILLGIIIRNKIKTKNTENKKLKQIPKKFGKILSSSIINSFNTLFIILGSIIIFVIFSNLISFIFQNNVVFNTIINSVLEITAGIKKISILETDLNFKLLLTSFFLSFTGLSVHSQVMSIMSDYKINFKFILFYRFIAGIINTFLTSIVICFNIIV